MSPETWAITDRAIRELAPKALDAIGCRDQADRLRALGAITTPFTASEATSAAMAIRDRQHHRAPAWEVADLAVWTAYAAERGREELVRKRAAALKGAVDAILIHRAIAGEVSHDAR